MEAELFDRGNNETTTLLDLFDSGDPNTTSDCIYLEPSTSTAVYLTFGIVATIIGMAGLVGNTLSIVVMSNSNMKLSINCCLIGLAVFDNILIISATILYSIANICSSEDSCFLYNRHMYPYIDYYMYVLIMVGQTGSVWMTVAVTIERYIAVCFPLKARSLCTYGRARQFVVVISVFAVMYNIPRIMEYEEDEYLDECSNLESNKTASEQMIWAVQNKYYFDIYATWMYLSVMYLIPLVSLAVLNGLIWNNIRKANLTRQQLSGQQTTERRHTVMLSCVVAEFFLFNLPDLIIRIMHMKGVHSDEMHEVQDLMLISNSSANFVIYCTLGQMFRHDLLRMLRSCCPSSLCGRRQVAIGEEPNNDQLTHELQLSSKSSPDISQNETSAV